MCTQQSTGRPTIPTQQLIDLRQKAHHLKPTVFIGQKGNSAAVIQEAESALQAHALIKIKIRLKNREERHNVTQEIATSLNALIVDEIGLVSVIYRPRADENHQSSESPSRTRKKSSLKPQLRKNSEKYAKKRTSCSVKKKECNVFK